MYSHKVPAYWTEEILPACNHFKKTNFKTAKEMMTVLYAQEQSADRVGDILGVCGNAVEKFLNAYNIPRVPAGGYRASNSLWKILREIPVKELETLTSKEIAKRTGLTQDTVTRVLRSVELKYNKKGNGHTRKGYFEKIYALPKEEVAKMTSKQIAELIGCTNKHVQFLLNREKVQYIHLNKKGIERREKCLI